MKIRSKFASLIIEDEDGMRHIVSRVNLQQDSRVVCDFGKWWLESNPDIPESLHDTKIIRQMFQDWLAPESGETFWENKP